MTELTPAARRSSGLRERRRQETRLDIADAATRLVAEHGMDRTTVEMIAEQAGISPRTFFNYFATKAEAVLARIIDALAVLPGILAARPASENPLIAVREAFCQLAALTPPDGPQLWAITEADATLKAELDRVFRAVGSQLTAGLAARNPQNSAHLASAEVAVAVGFALLGLAYRDSVAGPVRGAVSPDRLREYFQVLHRLQ